MTVGATTHVLPRGQWRERARAHAARVDGWARGRRDRRLRGQRHPVDDFLWEYYPYSVGRLRRWHPGPQVALEGVADEVATVPGFRCADDRTVFDWQWLAAHQRDRLTRELPTVLRLLQGSARRPGRFGCFGLHEWAMVLGQSADEVRHAGWPLRVSPEQVRATIDEVGLRCTHIDAYRFFTTQALPLNPIVPTRETQPDLDQSGCLHVSMDLYKWSMRMQPLVSMDLVADCFALAREVRLLDMRGAPYDLSDLGVIPLRLETAEGRAQFAHEQRVQSQQAQGLRQRLIEALAPFPPA